MKFRKTSVALLLSTFGLPLFACNLDVDGGDGDGDGITPTGGTTGTGGLGSGGLGSGGLGSGGSPGGTGGAPSSGGAGSGGLPGSGGNGSGGDPQGTGGEGAGGSPVVSGDPVEDSGLDCTVASPSGSNGGDSDTLPDPFTKWDGNQVTSMEDWRCRRRELVVEIEDKILGQKAPPPHTIGGSVDGSVSESSYTVEVDNPGGTASFGGSVDLPSSGSAPYPAVIAYIMPPFAPSHNLPGDVLDSEGIAVLNLPVSDVSSEASGDFSSGEYFQANPEYIGNTSATVAWAWGVSRIIDMLEANPGLIDPTKIAVHGCSRLGKGAYVAGAFDQRIALGLPLEPGTGGPAPLRALPVFGGQTLSSANGEASWFGPMSGSYSSSMAVDMNDLVAMYAPRGLLMMDNAHIDHLSYKANFLGVAAGAKLYDAMGAGDAVWYLGDSSDGNHCSARASDYGPAIRAMIQKFLKGDSTPTTGGLDTHGNHGNIDVDGWTDSWTEGTITP